VAGAHGASNSLTGRGVVATLTARLPFTRAWALVADASHVPAMTEPGGSLTMRTMSSRATCARGRSVMDASVTLAEAELSIFGAGEGSKFADLGITELRRWNESRPRSSSGVPVPNGRGRTGFDLAGRDSSCGSIAATRPGKYISTSISSNTRSVGLTRMSLSTPAVDRALHA